MGLIDRIKSANKRFAAAVAVAALTVTTAAAVGMVSSGALATMFASSDLTAQNAEESAPSTSKDLIRNTDADGDWDGTYTLKLSVTGSSNTTKQKSGSNVTLVLDTSGSMGFFIPSSRLTVFNLVDATHVTVGGTDYEIEIDDQGNRFFQYSDTERYVKNGSGNSWTSYWKSSSGETYYPRSYWGYQNYFINDPSLARMQTRAEVGAGAVTKVIDQLLSTNSAVHPDAVRVSLVSFDNVARRELLYSSDASELKRVAVAAIKNNGGGTNWEDALKLASDVVDEHAARSAAEGREDVTEYVVFASDGNPTFHVTQGSDTRWTRMSSANKDDQLDSNWYWSGGYLYTKPGTTKPYHAVWGTGSESPSVNVALSYENAVDDAKALVDKGVVFDGVAVFGDVSRMESLVSSAYSGTDKSASDYFQNASDQSSLEAAFSNLAKLINRSDGYTDVVVSDALSNYTLNEEKSYSNVPGPNGKVDNDSNYTLAPSQWEFEKRSKDGSVAQLRLGVEVPEESVNIKTDGGHIRGIVWDTGKIVEDGGDYIEKDGVRHYVLEDGATYVASLKVRPSQEAFDVIAYLSSKNYAYPLTHSQLMDVREKFPDFKETDFAYSNGQWNVLSNVGKAAIDYAHAVVDKVNPDKSTISTPAEHSDMENIPDMSTTTSSILVKKEWKDDDKLKAQRPAWVKMRVKALIQAADGSFGPYVGKDGEAVFYDATLAKDAGWATAITVPSSPDKLFYQAVELDDDGNEVSDKIGPIDGVDASDDRYVFSSDPAPIQGFFKKDLVVSGVNALKNDAELDIEKIVVGTNNAEITSDTTRFGFEVSLQGADASDDAPAGTPATLKPLDGEFDYKVYDSRGVEVPGSAGKISHGGVINLFEGQKAKIVGLPVGANYTVTETAMLQADGDGNYTEDVSSEYEIVTDENASGSGYVTNNTEGAIITKKPGGNTYLAESRVVNRYLKTNMNYAIHKDLKGSEQKAGDYSFKVLTAGYDPALVEGMSPEEVRQAMDLTNEVMSRGWPGYTGKAYYESGSGAYDPGTDLSSSSMTWNGTLILRSEDVGKDLLWVISEATTDEEFAESNASGVPVKRQNGVRYDTKVHWIKWHVNSLTGGPDGGPDITRTTDLPQYSNEVHFLNTYEPEHVKAAVRADKVLKGRKPLDGDRFELVLSATGSTKSKLEEAQDNPSVVAGVSLGSDEADRRGSVSGFAEGGSFAPTPDGSALSFTAPFAFDDLEFSRSGTYTFSLTERLAGQTVDSLAYDSKTVPVIVTVADKKDEHGVATGKLEVESIVYGGSSSQPSFTNVYSSSKLLSDTVKLKVDKVLSGKPLVQRQFMYSVTFEGTGGASNKGLYGPHYNAGLTYEEASAPSASATIGAPYPVRNNARTIEDAFNDMVFTNFDAGKTFTWTFAETRGNAGGITYDHTEFKISIAVKDDGKGGITFDVVDRNSNFKVSAVDDGGIEKSLYTATFSNAYEPKSIEVAPKAYKELVGRDGIEGGRFDFTLTPSSDTLEAIVSGKLALPNGAAADGVMKTSIETTGMTSESQRGFSFDPIEFKKAGTYVFVMRESNTGKPGVTYADEDVAVTFVVTDSGYDGQLDVVVNYDNGLTPHKFVNRYDNAIKYDNIGVIGADKVLVGRPSSDKQFKFKLVATDESGDLSGSADKLKAAVEAEDPSNAGLSAGEDEGVFYFYSQKSGDGEAKELVTESGASFKDIIGNIVFTNLDQGKRFSWSIEEVIPDQVPSGYSYDTASDSPGEKHAIVARVEDDGRGTLSVGTYIDGEDVGVFTKSIGESRGAHEGLPIGAVHFRNGYSTSEASYIPNAAKMLMGRDALPGEFEFNLYNLSDPDKKAVSSAVSPAITEDVLSDLTFSPAVTYTVESLRASVDAGLATYRDSDPDHSGKTTYTFHYALEETGAHGGSLPAGVSAIRPNVNVNVVVIDNGDGTLSVVADEASDDKKLELLNLYATDSVTVAFQGSKQLSKPTNTPLPTISSIAGHFDFTLSAEKGTPMPENAVEANGRSTYTVQNDAAGNVDFPEIEYRMEHMVDDEGHHVSDKDFVYTVVETRNPNFPDPEGISLDGTNNATRTVVIHVHDDGAGHLTHTSTPESTSKYTFVNTYNPDPATIELSSEKLLEGPKDLTEGMFKYTLRTGSKNGAIVVAADGTEIKDVPNKAAGTGADPSQNSGKIELPEISFTSAGSYTFVLSENEEGATILSDGSHVKDGIVYDEGGVTFTVVVSDDGKGNLVAALQPGTGKKSFVNSYRPSPAKAAFSVSKVLMGRSPLRGETFSFAVAPADAATEIAVAEDKVSMPDSLVATTGGFADASVGGVVSARATALFESIAFNAAGDYRFKVTENVPENTAAGLAYDSHELFINVKVVDDGLGKLSASVSYEGAEAATFTNVFTPAVLVPIEVSKNLTGRTPGIQPDEFKFSLSVLNDADPDRSSGFATGRTTASNDADGTVRFDEVRFFNEGAYTVAVREVVPAASERSPFVSYDSENVFTYKVTVARQPDGSLVATTSNELGSRVFTNKYEPPANEKGVYYPQAPTASIDGKVVGIGDELLYRVKWVNDAVDPATGKSAPSRITVTDKIPEGTEFVEGTQTSDVSGTVAAYDNASRTVVWEIPQQPAGATGTVTFKVKVTETAAVSVDRIENRASIKVGSNSPKQTNEVSNTVPKKSVYADDAYEDSAKGGVVDGFLYYDITFKNTRGAGAWADVIDELGVGQTYVDGSATANLNADDPASSYALAAPTSVSGSDATGTRIAWRFDNISDNATVSVRFKVKVTARSLAEVANFALANNKKTNVTRVPVPGENKKEVFKANDASLAANIDGKMVGVGDEISYYVTWSAASAGEAVLTDEVPAGTTFVKAENGGQLATVGGKQVVQWKLGDVPAGSKGRVSFTVRIDESACMLDSVNNKAELSVNKGHPTFTNEVRNTVPKKKADKTATFVGDELTYSIAFKNSEGAGASAKVLDILGAGQEYVSGSASFEGGVSAAVDPEIAPGDNGAVNLIWDLSDIPAGATVKVTFKAKVTSEVGMTVENQARVNDSKTNTVKTPLNKKDVFADGSDIDDPKASIDGKMVSVGGVLTYTVRWSNDSSDTSDVTVTDSIPQHTVYVPDSAASSVPGTHITQSDPIVWVIPAQPAGASGTVTFKVAVDASAAGETLDNTATIKVGDHSSRTNTVTNAAPVKSVFSADGTADPAQVKAGDVLAYTIEWTSTDADGSTAEVVDAMSKGLDYVSGSATVAIGSASQSAIDPNQIEGDASTGETLTWSSIGPIDKGQIVKVSFKARVTRDSVATVDNKAAVNDHGTNKVTTPVPGDNEKTVSIIDLQGVKTDVNGKLVGVGDELVYTIEWYAAKSGEVVVADSVPVGADFVSAEDGGLGVDAAIALEDADGAKTILIGDVDSHLTADPASTRAVIWKLGQKEAGAKGVVSFKARVGESARTVDSVRNTALVKVGDDNPIPTNPVENPTPKKSVDKTSSVKPGDELVYTIAFLNTEGDDASAKVVDRMSKGQRFDRIISVDGATADPETPDISGGAEEGQTLTWSNLTGMAKNKTVAIKFAVKVTEDAVDTGSVNNVAAINGHDTNVVATSVDGKKVSSPEDPTTSINGRSVGVDSELIYTIRWSNDAVDPATGERVAAKVTVTDTVPSGTSFIEAEGGVVPDVSGKLIWSIDADAGQTGVLSFKVKVTEAAVKKGSVDNTAVIKVGDNGSEHSTNAVVNPTPRKDVFAAGKANASIDGRMVGAGDELTYAIYWNAGEGGEVVVTDEIPENTELVEALDNGIATDGMLTWTLGQQVAGASGEVRFTVRVLDSAAGTDIQNEAKVRVGDHDPKHTNKVVNTVPKKSVSVESAKVNDVVTYTIEFTSDADGPTTVVDTLPVGTKFNVGSGKLDASALAEKFAVGRDVAWEFATVKGQAYTLTFDATVTADAADSLLNTGAVNGHATNTVTTKVYRASGKAVVEAKKVLRAQELKAGQFSFELLDSKGDRVGDVVTNDADGTVRFPELTYDELQVGEFQYAIHELRVDGAPYDYAADQQVKVKVTDDKNGTMVTEVTYSGSTDIPTMTNIYHASGSVAPTIAKRLENMRIANGLFSFKIEDAQTGEVIAEAHNDANGKVAFSPIEYRHDADRNDVGVHHYKISEVKGDLKGVTYSDEVIDLTVTVKDPGTGNLEVSSSYSGDATITNVYKGNGSALVAASKTLTGKELSDGQFVFELQDENGTKIKEASNNAAGSVVFELPYRIEDIVSTEKAEMPSKTFTYYIVERNDGKSGYTYDSHKEKVTVTVADRGDGTLDTKVSYATDKGAVFKNAYKASGSLDLGATKVLEGMRLSDGQFRFQLRDASTGELVAEGVNAASGAIVIHKDYSIASDEDAERVLGTHRYKLVEVDEGQIGMTYDKSEIPLSVEVSDNGDGTLKVEASGYSTATIRNAYKPLEGAIELTARKVLEGRPLISGEFDFELVDAQGNVVSTASNAADGSIRFGPIRLTEVGEVEFLLREVAGQDEDIAYDRAVSTVKVAVTDNGGKLEGSVASTGSGDTGVTFTNVYNPPAEPPVTPPVAVPPAVDRVVKVLPVTGESLAAHVVLGAVLVASISFAGIAYRRRCRR